MVEWGGTAQVLKSEMNVPTCCLNRRLVSRSWSGVAYLVEDTQVGRCANPNMNFLTCCLAVNDILILLAQDRLNLCVKDHYD
jgi:hypothetical protein